MEGRQTPAQEKYLPKLDKIPHEMMIKVMDGGNLPGLTAEETKTIKVIVILFLILLSFLGVLH